MLPRVVADLTVSHGQRANRRPVDRFGASCVQMRHNPASGSCQPRAASACQADLMSLGKLGCEGERFTDIRFFEIREIGQELLYGATRGHGLDNHSDGHTHAPNTRLPSHNFRIDCDPPQHLHTYILP
jgi:hypothetical protein